MSEYLLNEFSFQMPEGLKDKTNHIFALTDDGPSEFNIVVSRSPIDARETMGSYRFRLKQELSRALAGFNLLSEREITLDGSPALELRFQWFLQGRPMHQTQVSFFQQIEDDPRLVVQIAGTVDGAQPGRWEEPFQKMLSTVVLRGKAQQPLAPVIPLYPTTY